jgi:hypothetical protein
MLQDQEFSSDMNSRSVCRVKAVQFLRDCQFDEGDVHAHYFIRALTKFAFFRSRSDGPSDSA